jgi:hypothetical protein
VSGVDKHRSVVESGRGRSALLGTDLFLKEDLLSGQRVARVNATHPAHRCRLATTVNKDSSYSCSPTALEISEARQKMAAFSATILAHHRKRPIVPLALLLTRHQRAAISAPPPAA